MKTNIKPLILAIGFGLLLLAPQKSGAFYNPSTGKWLSRDPAEEEEGGPNLYSFVANNPISRIDDLGLAFYAVDGTWTDSSDRANPWQLYKETKEQPARYWRGPNLPGSDVVAIAVRVYSQIQADFCEAKRAANELKINLTGWSRGSMVAAYVASLIDGLGFWCNDCELLKHYKPVTVNWVGLFDTVSMARDRGFPRAVPGNVAHFDHAIKTAKQRKFPTWHFTGGNERAFNRRDGSPTTHRDIGESKILNNNDSYIWIKGQAVAAGVAF